MDDLKALIRDVPDFPKAGIVFKDITPLLADAEAFDRALAHMARPWQGNGVTHVIGIESRGFIVGSPVASRLGAGFVPVRKPGKLPWRTVSQSYSLEYGTDSLEAHADAVGPGDRVVIIDDVLATGGTGAATIALMRSLGAEVVGFGVLVELGFLGGRGRIPVHLEAVIRVD
ncbi:MAG TPA: adenine phosphoribosyltransferase [Actinobacteria bacterium]|nr:adenine phosphoribosyltransferase [Actinomycetota bacterium]